jgi:plasmid stability protein
MSAITIRNLPEAVHRALRVRAAGNGRSTEAEIRDILEKAVKPEQRVRIGDALAALGRRAHLTDKDLSILERSRKPAEPIRIE